MNTLYALFALITYPAGGTFLTSFCFNAKDMEQLEYKIKRWRVQYETGGYSIANMLMTEVPRDLYHAVE